MGYGKRFDDSNISLKNTEENVIISYFDFKKILAKHGYTYQKVCKGKDKELLDLVKIGFQLNVLTLQDVEYLFQDGLSLVDARYYYSKVIRR